MVLKTFMARRNTKVYFVILLLLALLFSGILCLNRYYIKKNNSNFDGSYIFIPQSKKDSEFLELFDDNINRIIHGIELEFEEIPRYIIVDDSIQPGYVCVTNDYYDIAYSMLSNYDIGINICNNKLHGIIYFNSSDMERLNMKYNNGNIVTLKDWSELNSINDYFKNNNIPISINYSINYDNNVLNVINVLKKSLVVVSVLLLILFLLIIIDLILDGSKKTSLLFILGLNRTGVTKVIISEIIIYLLYFLIVLYITTLILNCFLGIT